MQQTKQIPRTISTKTFQHRHYTKNMDNSKEKKNLESCKTLKKEGQETITNYLLSMYVLIH